MLRPPPPLVALVAGLAQRQIAGEVAPRGAFRTAGSAVLALASVSMAGAAAGSFRRRGTTVDPFRPEEASVLVTGGVLSLTRNPMYVGMAGVLAAHAVWRASWTALGPLAAFVVLMDRTQIRAEESALREKFGGDFEAFCEASPRWITPGSLAISSGPRRPQ